MFKKRSTLEHIHILEEGGGPNNSFSENIKKVLPYLFSFYPHHLCEQEAPEKNVIIII